jgi:hypothetical protein
MVQGVPHGGDLAPCCGERAARGGDEGVRSAKMHAVTETRSIQRVGGARVRDIDLMTAHDAGYQGNEGDACHPSGCGFRV